MLNIVRISYEKLQCDYPEYGKKGASGYYVQVEVAGQISNTKELVYCEDVKIKNIVEGDSGDAAGTSGGPFAKRPRVMLVKILEFFTIYEVAQLQRFVCREFRDAGQERIRERGGRKLFERKCKVLFFKF